MSAQREKDVTQGETQPELEVTREPGLVARALAALVRAYQLTLSPRLASSCRFEPSCSAYAHEALLIHGAGRGGWLAVRRLLRCHPFSSAGYDPVPPLLLDRGPGSDVVGDNVVARSGDGLPLVPAVPGRHDLPTEE